MCVITHNHARYIRRCLQSIVDQRTNFYFEVIIGEDCSSDGTRDIVQEFVNKYPNMFRALLHKTNIGGCNNYRSVHFAAKGEYIAHLDGDDYWNQGKLQSQIDFMECNQECAAVYTNAWVKSDSGELLGVFSSGVKRLFGLSYLLEARNFLTGSSLLYRQKLTDYVIPAAGDFIDFQIHIRLSQCGQLGFINENLVTYTYRSATSILASDNSRVRGLMWKSLCDIDLPKEGTWAIDKARTAFIIESILIEFARGNPKGGAAWIAQLPNYSRKSTLSLRIKMFYAVLINILDRLLGRIRCLLKRRGQNYVFFRK